MHNGSVFNYLLERYFSDWNPGGQAAFGQGLEEILGREASTMLAAIGKAQQMQQGTSGKAGFVNGAGFFPSPFSHGSSNCIQPICSQVTVVFLCSFIGVHLKLLLLPEVFFGSNCKINVHFLDLATELRNILCEQPRVTSGQQVLTSCCMPGISTVTLWEISGFAHRAEIRICNWKCYFEYLFKIPFTALRICNRLLLFHDN